LVICFAIGFYVVADWQEPTEAPPEGNAPTPINVGSDAQTKAGDLTINGVLKTLQDMLVNLVTIKGDGSISTNLNSDKLDGYSAADLMAGGVPSGMIAMFDTSCPGGWTRFTALDNRFPMGGGYGATGGSSSHTHTARVSSGDCYVGTVGCSGYNTGIKSLPGTGAHYVVPQSISTSDHLPPYLTVIWCKKD